MEGKIDYTKIANRVNEILGLTSKSRKYYNGKPLAEHFNDEMLKYGFVFGQKANGKTT